MTKDRWVVVTDDDFDKARVKATRTFEIRDFVPSHAERRPGANAAGRRPQRRAA